ncbi:MAG: ECF RNA polymerase sigma factor RpoE [Alphaproteobacteria bacterium ADurb.BinA280]|jgi:RNA polymerase sigma-70 factor (ECF subfamily)|nr:MAG: ECF RNA polymerase sigma factor RpoE [Alphaproteobacteria bacterium ADurb.BinA280]
MPLGQVALGSATNRRAAHGVMADLLACLLLQQPIRSVRVRVALQMVPKPPADLAPSGSDDGDPRSDEALMLAYAADDAAAFTRLYARHRQSLFGFLWRGLQDQAMVEECFQDVWSRVVHARLRYQPESRFGTWLLQIAHHRMADEWRKRRPPTLSAEAQEFALQHVVDEQANPEQDMSDMQAQQRLQAALRALPDEQRVAIQLRLAQELPLEQIADITGVGRETVKSRLRYAVDKLRASLCP